MIGFGPAISSDPRFAPSHNKSTRFAESLSGKFFVPGISGSFQKYDKQLQMLSEEGKERKLKGRAPSHLELKTQEELRKDTERLAELEKQLNEVSSFLVSIFK